MTKTISFANQKGGVGKTTLVMQTVHYLAKRGHKVLVLDFDPQANTTTRLTGQQNGFVYEGRMLFEDANTPATVTPTLVENVQIIPSEMNCDLFYNVETLGEEAILRPKALIDVIREDYEYIIIDTPPTLGKKLLGALVMTDFVVIPVRLSGFAVDGVQGLIRTITEVRDTINPNLVVAGMVANALNTRSQKDAEVLEALREQVGDILLDTTIATRTALDHATTDGLSIEDVKKTSARLAKNEVIEVIENLLGRME